MASVFGHVAASAAIGYAFFPKQVRPATFLLAGFCAFVPDFDVLAFRFGIPYESEWGHRGWTHSIVFAVVFSGITGMLYRLLSMPPAGGQGGSTEGHSSALLTAWLFLSTLSHPLLDMLTNGGRGCALWWPFSTDRIFFPERPIQVSPMSIGGFISEWGLTVLASELIWIGVPGLILVLLAKWTRQMR